VGSATTSSERTKSQAGDKGRNKHQEVRPYVSRRRLPQTQIVASAAVGTNLPVISTLFVPPGIMRVGTSRRRPNYREPALLRRRHDRPGRPARAPFGRWDARRHPQGLGIAVAAHQCSWGISLRWPDDPRCLRAGCFGPPRKPATAGIGTGVEHRLDERLHLYSGVGVGKLLLIWSWYWFNLRVISCIFCRLAVGSLISGESCTGLWKSWIIER
jgi:hypothetical protein